MRENIVCKEGSCTGCHACIDICTKNAIKIVDDLYQYNAVIDQSKCIHCGACQKICQNNSQIDLLKPLMWKQGWALDQEIRAKGSSGGFATAIAKAFLISGGEVCSCVFKNGQFIFDFIASMDDLYKLSGSKYVKSHPVGIYKTTVQKLKTGIKILFIGLPCQIAALKIFVPTKLQDNLYTIDLICHGTPSPTFLQLYLQQRGLNIMGFSEINFRTKTYFRIEKDGVPIDTSGVSDAYTTAFLNSLTYTDNCYNCKYATIERVSDITLGDSWESMLSADEKKKGISLAICQTNKGIDLLQQAEVLLLDVDIENAKSHNHQLEHASISPKSRRTFFRNIKLEKKVGIQIAKALPIPVFKQRVKHYLVKIGLVKM